MTNTGLSEMDWSPQTLNRADGVLREESFSGKVLTAGLLEKGNDIVFHLGNPHSDFQQIIVEVVNDFFEDAETFGIEYLEEVDCYSLYALGMANNPLVDSWKRAKAFLTLLDNTLGALND